jgi:hypothetical protein
MSIDDNTSENMPVIKSRTGKFLQGMFDKKSTAPKASGSRNAVDRATSELLQMVPEQTIWDESEESNWDDDFVEAPQPAFIAPQTYPKAVESPASSSPVPPPPPSAISSNSEGWDELDQMLATEPVAEVAPADLPKASTATPKAVAALPENSSDEPIAVSIPRPKNIKYKTKDPNAAPVAAKSEEGSNKAIELDIQRPKNIKYKTKPPVKASLPERLLAPLKSLFAKKPLINTNPPNEPVTPTPKSKKSWQLPSLGSENFRQILAIAGVVFLAMTVAWAVINFWPSSRSLATKPPTVIPQPAPVKTPLVSPEAALVEAVKSRSQALAGLYPAGLITDLELDADRGLATVIVGNLWFSLTPEQQQQTAQSLWLQARNYQMSGLEVRVTTDRLVARSPFVGNEAILVNS